jgi:acyl-coenzyme A synthetase/AMP-(fatty) acid ligase
MALHELEVYPQIAPLACSDRVLHQSSAYWGATSLGIFDVAWACGGCLVLTEAGAGPAEVTRVVELHKITVAGIVPSVLEALEDTRCLSLRIVFTWGEALAASTAARWARRVAMLDLLIATEYWLILYADHGRGSSSQAAGGFRPVPGARLTLRPPESENAGEGFGEEAMAMEVEVGDGEVGELYLGGPMVSGIGYTEATRNVGAFVDLPVGSGGELVRHFRTRDLARRRPDGSLEYCGRADGFAKVGGKWLDLAAVERNLLAAGCKEASLVWDPNAKQRHAAVVLEQKGQATVSFSTRASQLQSMLPRGTRLHVLGELPHHPITGKIHRGVLVQQLAAATAPSDLGRGRPSAATLRVRRSLLIGFCLAARTGARGAGLLPLAWQLAPGLLPPSVGSRSGATGAAGGAGVRARATGLLDALPEGLSEHARSWASWFRHLGSCLKPIPLAALPYIMLLLLDAPATGLDRFMPL